MLVSVIIIIIGIVGLSPACEQQSGASLKRSLVNDRSIALVGVVAVEIADQAKTIVLRWCQHEFAVAEVVVANCWKSDLASLLLILVGDVDNGANVGDCREIGVSSDRCDLNGNDIWASPGARICDHVTLEVRASSGRQFAVILIVSVTTVLDSVADEQCSDALWVVRAALELPLAAAVTFQPHDALFERAGSLDPIGIDTGFDLGDQVVDAGRQVVESIVEFIEVC